MNIEELMEKIRQEIDEVIHRVVREEFDMNNNDEELLVDVIKNKLESEGIDTDE